MRPRYAPFCHTLLSEKFKSNKTDFKKCIKKVMEVIDYCLLTMCPVDYQEHSLLLFIKISHPVDHFCSKIIFNSPPLNITLSVIN